MIFGVPVFLAVVAFISVVFVHELGHYFIGRCCGIGATTFSIGFGPKLFSFTDKRNTEWMICLIPLGGYVKFVTENDKSNSPVRMVAGGNSTFQTFSTKGSFESASLIGRAMTVLAGPVANFLMSAIIFTFISSMTGVMSTEPIVGDVADLPGEAFSLMTGDRILSVEDEPVESFRQVYDAIATLDQISDIRLSIFRDGQILKLTIPHIFQPIVFDVEMFSPAMKAGLKEGDVFLEADEQSISSFEDLKSIIGSTNGKPITLKIWRNDQIIWTDLTPEMRPTETIDGNLIEQMRIGVRGGPLFSPAMVKPHLSESVWIGVRMTVYVIKTSLVGLARMIDQTISPKHLSGPIGVAKALSYTATEGFMPFFSLLATISAGIGLVNLFPIPILDGGHLMLFLYEGIFKKAPADRIIKFLMALGLTMLLALMVFATFNDILR